MPKRPIYPFVATELMYGRDDNTKAMPAGMNNRPMRGFEQNTARNVSMPPMITGITPVTYGADSDAPMVEGFRTYEEN